MHMCSAVIIIVTSWLRTAEGHAYLAQPSSKNEGTINSYQLAGTDFSASTRELLRTCPQQLKVFHWNPHFQCFICEEMRKGRFCNKEIVSEGSNHCAARATEYILSKSLKENGEANLDFISLPMVENSKQENDIADLVRKDWRLNDGVVAAHEGSYASITSFSDSTYPDVTGFLYNKAKWELTDGAQSLVDKWNWEKEFSINNGQAFEQRQGAPRHPLTFNLAQPSNPRAGLVVPLKPRTGNTFLRLLDPAKEAIYVIIYHGPHDVAPDFDSLLSSSLQFAGIFAMDAISAKLSDLEFDESVHELLFLGDTNLENGVGNKDMIEYILRQVYPGSRAVMGSKTETERATCCSDFHIARGTKGNALMGGFQWAGDRLITTIGGSGPLSPELQQGQNNSGNISLFVQGGAIDVESDKYWTSEVHDLNGVDTTFHTFHGFPHDWEFHLPLEWTFTIQPTVNFFVNIRNHSRPLAQARPNALMPPSPSLGLVVVCTLV